MVSDSAQLFKYFSHVLYVTQLSHLNKNISHLLHGFLEKSEKQWHKKQ